MLRAMPVPISIPTRNHLSVATERFFSLHWRLPAEVPIWDFSWSFSGPVPNYLLGGLYALFSHESLVYIGLGASRGGGAYKDRGISRRLMAHVLKPATSGSCTDYVLSERWKSAGVDSIATLGFPSDVNYLAPALEDYLIGMLAPRENVAKNPSRSSY